MGNSFHWMDRARVLDELYDIISDDGGLAVVGHGAPIPPPPTPWRAAINEVLKRYLGELPPYPPPEGAPRSVYRTFTLQRS